MIADETTIQQCPNEVTTSHCRASIYNFTPVVLMIMMIGQSHNHTNEITKIKSS